MSPTIRIAPDGVRTNPDIEGVEVSDGTWHLHVDRYREFLFESTGISPCDRLSASDCYRIGNRLQALIEDHKRDDEWGPNLVETYPEIDSLQEFLWIARFFRACHDCHNADEICYSGTEDGDVICSREDQQ